MAATAAPGVSAGLPDGRIRHVLLISIDGMHALDFINCAQGISGIKGGASYCPHLAALAERGVNYLGASTSKPSNSFPGLMALVTGGSPRSVGAFYDVAYDRSLDPPAKTTGNGVPRTVTSPVETAQIAPTILSALRLDPDALEAVPGAYPDIARRSVRRRRPVGPGPAAAVGMLDRPGRIHSRGHDTARGFVQSAGAAEAVATGGQMAQAERQDQCAAGGARR